MFVLGAEWRSSSPPQRLYFEKTYFRHANIVISIAAPGYASTRHAGVYATAPILPLRLFRAMTFAEESAARQNTR